MQQISYRLTVYCNITKASIFLNMALLQKKFPLCVSGVSADSTKTSRCSAD